MSLYRAPRNKGRPGRCVSAVDGPLPVEPTRRTGEAEIGAVPGKLAGGEGASPRAALWALARQRDPWCVSGLTRIRG
jgi:hypothetical protein